MPPFWHRTAVEWVVMVDFLTTCWDACRVAVGQAGMNLAQSVAVFVLEIAARFGRGFLSRGR